MSATAGDLSVFGFTLGEPLKLQECPSRLVAGTKLYEIQPPFTCYEAERRINGYAWPSRRIIFTAREHPIIVKNWNMVALERHGVLIGIEFGTNGASSQDVVFDELKRKFGPPTKTWTEGVQNAMGARFDSLSATWEGPIDVTFYGTLGKLDTGRVYIDLPEAVALRRRWNELEHSEERRL